MSVTAWLDGKYNPMMGELDTRCWAQLYDEIRSLEDWYFFNAWIRLAGTEEPLPVGTSRYSHLMAMALQSQANELVIRFELANDPSLVAVGFGNADRDSW